MADGLTLNSGSGGATLATDEISSQHYQRIKLIHGADGTNDGDVSDANPLPIDDAGGSLTVDNGGTFAVQVDAALPAGTNAIGKLAANSGVDIGDVDVTSVTPGTGASNLGKAEDAAHSSGDVGVMMLTVRQDTAAALGGTDGDYQPPITDASGRLHVNVGNTVTVGSHAVTNAGTFAVQEDGAALTALQAIETAVEILDNAVSGNEMQVDVVAALPAGDNNIGNVDLASAIPAGTNNIGDVDVLTLPDAVEGPGSPTVDSYSTAAVSASANTADQSLVAAPGASKQIWVYGLVLTADTGDGSFSLQDEDNTALSGVMAISQRGGFVLNPSGNFAMPWIKVATNKALEIDTVTCGAKGTITYAIVSV